MFQIPFVKYTSCGNNFVIVDETERQILCEADKSRFAWEATNSEFGVGCDNLLVIQRCTKQTLDAINEHRGYWQASPEADQADYLFRMFEPDGREALCCGNGLMSIAHYLHARHGVDVVSILTELPLAEPRPVTIGTAVGHLGSWANMGYPRRTPTALVDRDALSVFDDQMDFVDDLIVRFRSHDLKPYTPETSLALAGYLVFTGEPHLVVFPEQMFSVPELADCIFGESSTSDKAAIQGHQRASFGTWLVDRIGAYLNTHYTDLFPAGINVNFARRTASGELEYRCYERGINRETLACGTGALAVAYVARRGLGLTSPSLTVLPHRCRWHAPDAEIGVRQTQDGWLLKADPRLLFEGSYQLRQSGNQWHSDTRMVGAAKLDSNQLCVATL